MERRIRIACMGLYMGLAFLAITPVSLLQAATLLQPDGIPEAGKAGAFTGPKTDLSGLNKGISPKAAGSALAGLRANSETVRGGVDSALYKRIAPAVVMVVTDKGLGSGSLISKDGQILTNNHVVAGFQTVGVIFKPAKDGDKITSSQVITADVIKTDPTMDLALLKLRTAPPGTIPLITFGDFDKVNVGDDVSAIGHPEGEIWTYTKGYVSQIRRDYQWKNSGEGIAHKADVIQTQTPINPGNSGGPLLNSAGALIGVNAFVKTDGQNISFAIGVDTVQDFLKRPAGAPVAVASAEDANCEPHLMFEGRDDKNTASVQRFDMNCHGRADLAIVLPDDKTKPMFAVVDTADSGKPDGEIISYHRDGHWDISYWDTKHTGHWDTIGYHPDGKIKPTSYGPYIPTGIPTGGDPGAP
jgi:S1-C subfamily serine protease